MKGIILAGGRGTRLYPLTKVTNKHLLPIWNKPMIYYPIECLINSGIKDIMIISGGENIGDFMSLLGSGKNFNCRFTYRVQDQPDGIAGALKLAEDFVSEKFIVILGDNIFSKGLKDFAKKFENKEVNMQLLLKRVKNPERFGVCVFKGQKLVGLIEKPKNPPSNVIITGCYGFDKNIFSILKKLRKSDRNEYEISEAIDDAIKNPNFKVDYDYYRFKWSDSGTFVSMYNASNYMKNGVFNG